MSNIINKNINIFFVFSFLYITYSFNIYIAYILCCVFIIYIIDIKQRIYMISFLLIFFLPFLYTSLFGIRSGYRAIKTIAVFFPVFLLYNKDIKVNKILHYFFLLSALFVYIDYILLNTIGKTITRIAFSGITPRFPGLMEDSNFFSYALLVYIQYLYMINKKYNIYFIIAFFLSMSISAILVFIVLTLFNYINKPRFKKYLFTVGMFVIIIIYYYLIYNSFDLRHLTNKYQTQIVIKLISMSLRLEAQSEVFSILNTPRLLLFGIGAGETRNVILKEMNLHNSYLQIMLEMGYILLTFVIWTVIYIYKRINILFIPIFCSIILLGNILEVVYFPLIPFVYFLSKSYENEKIRINNNNYNN